MTPTTSRSSHFRLTPFALAIATLSACAGTPVAPAAPGGPVNVHARVSLKAPGGYRLKSEPGLTGYVAEDVAYLKVFLSREGGAEQDLGQFPFDGTPLAIRNLRMATAYTVRLEAYAEGDTRIDANADDEPGDDDVEGCETSFTTTDAPELTLADPFTVTLADRIFAGRVSGNVSLTPGGVKNTTIDEELDLGAPPPPPPGTLPDPGQVVDYYAPAAGNPTVEAFDSAGNLFYVDHTRDRVVKVSPQGMAEDFFTLDHMTSGLAVDSQDNLYLAQPIDPGGGGSQLTTILQVTPGKAVTTLIEGLSVSQAVAVEPDDRIVTVAADTAGSAFRLGRITAGTPATISFFGGAQDPAPAIVKVGDDHFTTTGESGRVLRTSGQGDTTVYAQGLGNSTGLAADADGVLYVSDPTGNRVWRVSAGGVATDLAIPGLQNPYGLAVRGTTLFIASSGNPDQGIVGKIVAYGL